MNLLKFSSGIVLLAVFVVLAHSATVPTSDIFDGTCTFDANTDTSLLDDYVFSQGGTWSCAACPANSHRVTLNSIGNVPSEGCVCDNGYADVAAANTIGVTCESCLAQNKVVSLHRTSDGRGRCVSCGGGLPNLTSPVNSVTGRSLFMEAVFDAASGRCVCRSSGYVIAESFGSVAFTAQMCVDCTSFDGVLDAQTSSTLQSICTKCIAPKVWSSTTDSCVCGTGYTTIAIDGTCILTSVMNQVLSGRSSERLTITPVNMDNTGEVSPTAHPSYLLSAYTAVAAAQCSTGTNDTACSLLANLCVLNFYDLMTSPCSLYWSITKSLMSSCSGLACENTRGVIPWLYYLRSSGAILTSNPGYPLRGTSTTASVTVSSIPLRLGEKVQILLAKYHWTGVWLGNELITKQLSLCEDMSTTLTDFMEAGSKRRSLCNLNLRWLIGRAEPTLFYEMFVITDNPDDPSQSVMVPVPVLLDTSGRENTLFESVFDVPLQRPGATASPAGYVPAAQGYRRRFFLYDNIGGLATSTPHAVQSGEQELYPRSAFPAYYTVARSVQLLFTVKPGSSAIYVPLLILTYESRLVTFSDQNSDFKSSIGISLLQRTNLSTGPDVLPFQFAVTTTNDQSSIEQAMMVVVIVLCVLCFFSSMFRTYAWMRRGQSLLFGFDTMIRFCVYYCNHISNMFAGVVLGACWYFFIMYKYQYALEYSVPLESMQNGGSAYIFGMLYAATAAKGIVILYAIFEQTNADIFVIDWERSKGQLLREAKNCPVSFWRSTMVVNELNELQTELRKWRPLLCMFLVALFLEGLHYIQLGSSVPGSLRQQTNLGDVDAYTAMFVATAQPNRILRIAIASFFWVVIVVILYVLEYQVYYRFVKVHPLREFVDMCSVANISVIILLEPQWGYYIHGESIHAHADVSMEEFQENLYLESLGHLPSRGLGGHPNFQTFEVFISSYMRQYLWLCYGEVMREHNKALSGAVGPVHAGHHRRVFEFLLGMPGKTRVFTPETLMIRRRINEAFMQSVHSAEKTFMPKMPLHALFDLPPNILFMNGPFAGVGGGLMMPPQGFQTPTATPTNGAAGPGPNPQQQPPPPPQQHAVGQDLYFADDVEGFGNALLYGIDIPLCMWYLLLFLSIDTSLLNVFSSLVITYAVEIVIVWYRQYEGEANLGSKALIDDRFLL